MENFRVLLKLLARSEEHSSICHEGADTEKGYHVLPVTMVTGRRRPECMTLGKVAFLCGHFLGISGLVTLCT